MFVIRERLYAHPVYCMRSLSGFVNAVILPRNKLFRLRTKVAVFMHTAHVFISLSVSMCDLYYFTLKRRFVHTTSHTPPNRFCICTCLIVVYAGLRFFGRLETINLSTLKPSGLFSTTHCSILRLIVQFGLDVPNFATRRLRACHHARAPSGGRWNCAREMSGNFA
jgi:hypothetical protein